MSGAVDPDLDVALAAPTPLEDSPWPKRLLFCALIATMVVVNYDSGATAAVLNEFQRGCLPPSAEFDPRYPCLSKAEQGWLGALPYFGICLGCPVAGMLLHRCSEKTVIICGLFIESAATLTFSFTIQKYLLFGAKLVIGMSYSALRIYMPIWVDSFGPSAHKTSWLGLVQATGALGGVVGYGTAGYLTSSGIFYQYAFRIQSSALFLCACGIACARKNLIDQSCSSQQVRPGAAEVRDPYASFTVVAAEYSGFASLINANASQLLQAAGTSNVGVQRVSVCSLFRNRVFVFTTLARCVLFFVATSIQYWSSVYFHQAFSQPEYVVNAVFIGIACTAPVLGILMGGKLNDRQGGYSTASGRKRTAFSSTILSGLAAVAGIGAASVAPSDDPVRFVIVVVCIWFLLLFGAATLPPTTGLVLQSVEEEYRLYANTVAVVMYTVFGYGLGTLLPGQVMSLVGGQTNLGLYRAMQVTFFWGCLGFICMLNASVALFRASRA